MRSRNLSQLLPVYVAANLRSIIQLDTASQTLTVRVWFSITWLDAYLTWDPSQYGGVTFFTPEPEKVKLRNQTR